MDNLIPWFVLKAVPGIGPHLYKRLIEQFHSPDRVLAASEKALSSIHGFSARLVNSIKNHPLSDEIKIEIERVYKQGFQIITLNHPDYPSLLREIPDPPPYLYVHGRLTASIRNIAVVGSRNATPYGLEITESLCKGLVYHGMTIVSGMARGVDTAAHSGALAGKGKTIAVLGSGFDHVYPAENRTLFDRIAENGAVITEFPLAAEPNAHHFPQRNRIISGISLGTVVVEATKNSGSLITAKMAAEQNREVFAVPGSIHSHKSTGTHILIRQGAKLVVNAMDVMEEFSHLEGKTPSSGSPPAEEPEPDFSDMTPQERVVLNSVGPYPVHIDTLSRETALAPGELSAILLKLELAGIVRQTPGKFFCLSRSGKRV